MMKILVFAPVLDHGGVSKYSIRCTEMLKKEYSTVYLLTFKNIRNEKGVTQLDAKNLSEKILKLRSFFLEENIDTVISPIDLAPIFVRIASLFLNINLISVVHMRLKLYKSNNNNFIKRKIFNFFLRLSFKFSNQIICVSKELKKEVQSEIKINASKVKAIYNPIIKKLPQNKVKFKDIKNKREINLLTVGWICRLKNQKEILEAMALLKDHKYKLSVVGGVAEKDYYSEITQFIKENNLTERVFFLGIIDDIRDIFDRADIYIHSSKSEALPTVLVEALEYSTPIISRNCQFGPSEILEDGKYGIIYKDSGEVLSRNIEEISENKLYNHFITISKFKLKDFLYSTVLSEYKKIIERN